MVNWQSMVEPLLLAKVAREIERDDSKQFRQNDPELYNRLQRIKARLRARQTVEGSTV